MREEWDALLASSDSATIFLSLPWIESWLATFGRSAAPLVLVCRSENGLLRGVAPLFTLARPPFRLIRIARFLGDIRGESDNLDLLAVRGYEDVVADAALGALEQLRDRWDVLELRQIQRESRVVSHFRTGAHQRGWILEERTSPHVIIDLAPSWKAVLAGVSTKARWAATYMERNLPSAGAVESRTCTRRDELPYFFNALYDLHGERWSARGQSGKFRDPVRRLFYQQLAERLLDRGQLDFDVLELDGRPIAVHLGCRDATTYYLLESGFDPALARFRTGVGLTGRVIRRLIGDGITHYDFLEGDEQYRLRWSPRVSEYVHLLIARPRALGAIYLSATGALARARQAVRTGLATLARPTPHDSARPVTS